MLFVQTVVRARVQAIVQARVAFAYRSHAEHDPNRTHLEPQDRERCEQGDEDGVHGDKNLTSQIQRYGSHKGYSRGVDGIQEAGKPGAAAQSGNVGVHEAHQEEGWQEYACCGRQGAWQAVHEISNEGGCRKHRPGGELPHRYGIQQLLPGNPA